MTVMNLRLLWPAGIATKPHASPAVRETLESKSEHYNQWRKKKRCYSGLFPIKLVPIGKDPRLSWPACVDGRTEKIARLVDCRLRQRIVNSGFDAAILVGGVRRESLLNITTIH